MEQENVKGTDNNADQSTGNDGTGAREKEDKNTDATSETEAGETEEGEVVIVEIDDRLTDDLESIDFIDRDGEDEREITSEARI